MKKKKKKKEDYIQWCKEWINECLRILKKTGTFYCMAATQYMPFLDCYLADRSFIRARIVWCYDSSGVQAKNYFGSLYEPILMVINDKNNFIFNSEEVLVEAKTGAKRKLIDYRKTPPKPYNSKKVMGNVWNIPRVRYKMEEYENHPTQKPEKLLEIIIKVSSNTDDIVLDPFSGSFTTCAVAQKLGRKTVGIEINEEYYKMGLRRLNIVGTYQGQKLIKKKTRKTKNKSKSGHLNHKLESIKSFKN